MDCRARARGGRASLGARIRHVPGTLALTARIGAGAAEGDGTGLIALRHGSDVREIPYWLHVEVPRLAKPTRVLSKTGTYGGNNRNGKARVSSYRYPEGVRGVGLPGPEQVFAVHLRKPVANFGVRVVSQSRSVEVTPRVVRNGDENRLAGYVGLPGDLNPYRETLGESSRSPERFSPDAAPTTSSSTPRAA